MHGADHSVALVLRAACGPALRLCFGKDLTMEIATKQVFVFSTFRFDPASGQLTQNGVRIRITKQIADLLTVLLVNAGQLVTRQQIRDALWPGQEFVNYDKIITNSISRLRSIFQDDPAAPRYIESAPKRGYRFVAEVQTEGPPASVTPSTGAVQTDTAAEVPVVNEIAEESLTPQRQLRRRRIMTLSALAAGFLFATLGSVYWYAAQRRPEPTRIVSLGIAPFDTSGPGAEELAGSFRLDLTDSLSQLPQVQVRAAHSLELLKLNQATLHDAGTKLGLDAILFGRFTVAGDQCHLQFELVRGQDGTHVASFQYSGTKNELAAIRDKVQMETFARLKLAKAGMRPALGGTADPDAYDQYLRARYHFSQQTEDSLRLSLDEYKAAIAEDSNFAKAYAGEAHDYIFLWQHGVISAADGFAGASEAAQKALALDNTSADAHAALGVLYFLHDWKLEAGERELQLAVQLNPNQPIYHQWLALALSDEGRFPEAFHEVDLAHTLDPLWVSAYVTEAHVAGDSRDHARMEAIARKLMELQPDSAHVRDAVANVDWADGRWLDAIAAWRQMAVMEDDGARVRMEDEGLEAYRHGGVRAYARIRLQAASDKAMKARHPNDFDLAEWYAYAGEDEKALSSMRQEIRDRDPQILNIGVFPAYDGLRPEPQFQALLQQLGLSLPAPKNDTPAAPVVSKK
jgi:DNA-binding winged helix-turn-helix (wHTH) protein/TolB-like protein